MGDHGPTHKPTLGSLFAGIGGFDLGFENAGWETSWQVEIDPVNRAILGERFPRAQRFADVRDCGRANLPAVDCITAGFPCTDISNMGNQSQHGRPGLKGERSGLFYEVVRILQEMEPRWLVLENVAAILHSNHGEDLAAVVGTLSDCGYVGCWRVLDAQYFGVPQKRRRVFFVCGRREFPPMDFLADAAPVDSIPCTFGAGEFARSALSAPANTLIAQEKFGGSIIALGAANLIAHEGGWGAMVDRERASALRRLPAGMDPYTMRCKLGSGNAVVPAVAEWIGRLLHRSFGD
jgi:DNA (cytosine-5)-methyltransferase 1